MTLVHRMVSGFRERMPVVTGPEGADLRVDLMGLGQSKTGLMVSHDRAMTLTAVYASVRIIASSIASLPLNVYARAADGAKEPLRLDSERVIWDKPNPEVNRSTFWQTAVGHAVLTGNAFLYVVAAGDSPRRPAQLWPIEPKRVTDIRRSPTGAKVYVIDGAKEETDWVAGGRIVHVMGLSTDGMRGMSPIGAAREAVGLGLASQEFAARKFSNGSEPGGYLSTDQEITPAQASEISEMWEGQHKGVENAHRLAVLGKGTTWATTSLNPEDAQMLETRRFQVAEIARLFGVPPHLLGDVEKSTSWGTGIEEQSRGFVTYTLQPWLTAFEQTISDELLRVQNHFCEFDVGALIRGKLMDQVSAVGNLIRVGFEPSAALQAVGLDPIAHTGVIPQSGNPPPADTPAPVPA